MIRSSKVGKLVFLSSIPGDVVTHINGKAILTAKDFYRFMEGDEDLEMIVYRKTKQLKFLVQPEVL